METVHLISLIKKILGFLIFTAISQACFGQKTQFLNFVKLSQNEGLSSPNVRKILQDRFGFIWIATQDGINRFDGNNFIHFNANEKSKRRITEGNDFYDFIIDE